MNRRRTGLSRTKILLGPAPLGPVKSVTCGVSDQATIELRPILDRRANVNPPILPSREGQSCATSCRFRRRVTLLLLLLADLEANKRPLRPMDFQSRARAWSSLLPATRARRYYPTSFCAPKTQ